MELKDITPFLKDEEMRVKVDGKNTIGYTETFVEKYSDREIEYIGAAELWEDEDGIAFTIPVVDVWLKEKEHEA